MKRLFLPLALALGWFGCSGEQPGPGAEEDKLKTEAAFCGEWAKAVCTEEVVSACSGDRTNCLESQKSACQVLVPYGYRSKHAEDCLEAVSDAYADTDLSAEELEVVLRLGGACGRLVDGGQAEGEVCTESADCDMVSGLECVIRPGDETGTCRIPMEVGGGRRCSTAETVCEREFYCDGMICAERLFEGESCTGDVCGEGMRCAVATGDEDSTCIALLEDGQPCTSNEECSSRICIGTTMKECVSNVRLSAESSLCDNVQ